MTGVISYNVILILVASNKHSKTGLRSSLAALEADGKTFERLDLPSRLIKRCHNQG